MTPRYVDAIAARGNDAGALETKTCYVFSKSGAP
jgi:hypothetical protein